MRMLKYVYVLEKKNPGLKSIDRKSYLLYLSIPMYVFVYATNYQS